MITIIGVYNENNNLSCHQKFSFIKPPNKNDLSLNQFEYIKYIGSTEHEHINGSVISTV